MKVPEHNLYARNARIVVLEDGREELERDTLKPLPSEQDRYHLVSSDDTLEFLAFFYYQEIAERPEKYWFYIADANNIDEPFEPLPVGEILLIPSLSLIEFAKVA